MPAYWMARANPRDLRQLERYAAIVARLQPQYGVEPLARGRTFVELEGDARFEQYYLHRFPSMDLALAMFHSPEYQEAARIRRAACDGCELVVMEGGDALAI